MLPYIDYQNKWTNPAPAGFGRMLMDMPSYHDYLIREIYQQDYLDLYLGTMTFNRTIVGGIYYVQITGNPILSVLGIPLDPLFTLTMGGNDYIKVDYDYPWTIAQLNQKRCIKYIMIGEAAHPINDSYFYKHTSTVSSPWLSAPVAAFTPSPNGSVLTGPTKLEKLLYLADNGYILIDLFPFATNYTALRTVLNTTGVSTFFFNNEVLFRINQFVVNGLTCQNSNEQNSNGKNAYEPIIAFSGPPTIHHYLANEIAIGAILLPPTIVCRCYMNDTIPATIPTPPLYWNRPWTSMTALHGVFIPYVKAPYYRCCTCQNAIAGPNNLFIRVAFF